MHNHVSGKEDLSSFAAERTAVFKYDGTGSFLGKPLYFWSVLFCFFGAGFLYAQFTSRIPALGEHAGLDVSNIGLLLMSFGFGSVIGLCSAGFLFRYMQSKTLVTVAFSGFCAGLSCIAFMYSFVALLCAFALWGLCFSWIDISMNSQGMFLEGMTGKNCLAFLHANFSIGCGVGSAVSALFAAADMGIVINYTCMAVLTLFLFWAFFRKNLLPDPQFEEETDEKDKTVSKKNGSMPPFIFVCGIVAMLIFSVEGAGGEWGGMILHSAKGASESLSALAYGILAAAMASARLITDRIRNVVPDTVLIFISVLISLTALCGIIFTENALICLFLLALLGLGCAPIAPVCFSRAGSTPHVNPKTAAAVIGFIGYSGMLAIPPFIGLAAEYTGIENAFFIPVTALLLIMFLIPFFRRVG